MSARAPEPGTARRAFDELRRLVASLGGELAAFRRRALQAEAQLRALEQPTAAPEPAASAAPAPREAASPLGDPGVQADLARIAALEAENVELRRRLDAAIERTRLMLDRVHFLRQQEEQGSVR